MLVGNFTPDDIKWEHLGQLGTIPAGEVVDLPDARANFIHTKFGPRGLLKVEWKDKDDMGKYHDQAMATYRHFWEMQIARFNQQNEQMKNENKAYITPPKQLQEKADELGLELISPWKVLQKTDTKEIRDLKKENAELKDEMRELRTAFKEMIDIMKELKAKPATPVIVNTEDYLKQFRNLGKDRYKNWVVEHVDDIPKFPVSVYEAAASKWADFYKEPWPVEDCFGPGTVSGESFRT